MGIFVKEQSVIEIALNATGKKIENIGKITQKFAKLINKTDEHKNLRLVAGILKMKF